MTQPSVVSETDVRRTGGATASSVGVRRWQRGTRRRVIGGVALGIGLLAAACGSSTSTAASPSSTSTASSPSPGATTAPVHVATVSSVGSVLVTTSGRTLYLYTPDAQKAVTCTGSCAAIWPPLDVSNANPVAGPGIDSALLGTIRSSDALQVTYNRWPLYTYAGDSAAGQAKGQGLEGIWFAVTPAGTKASTSTSSSSAISTPTGGPSAGY